MQEKPYELDTILRLFLTGITAGDGLGFSRAMLFLTDQDGVLRGTAAIGPLTQPQAQEVWERFEHGGASLTHDLDFLLRQAAEFSDWIDEAKFCEYSPLSSAIQRLSLPINPAAGAPAESVIKTETVMVANGQEDPFRETIWQLMKPDDVKYPFASVPLVGKHTKRIGSLVVDNRFLWKEREIDPEDIEGLEAFARLLALSIENVYLQQKLTEEQKIESWREATASISHTMGTLLFEVQGDVKEVATHLCESHEDVWKDVEPMFRELYHGITKAERVLWDFRTFAAPTRLDLERVDFRQIVQSIRRGTAGLSR